MINPPELLDHGQNVALADNGVFLLFQFDLGAGVLADQNLLAGGHDHGDFIAVNETAGADFDNFIDLGLFLGGRGEENAGSGALLGFVLLENNSVC